MIERVRREQTARRAVTMRDALNDPHLLGASLQGTSWANWRVFLIASMGEKLNAKERKIFHRFTGRAREPGQRIEEGLYLIGRRGGKDRAAAVLATYFSALVDYSSVLAKGERGLVLCIAPDQRQALVQRNYVEGTFDASPILSALIVNRTTDSIELSNGISIEVRAASFRRLRGVTTIAVIASEAAFWMDEQSANADVEILNAVRPSLATTGGPLIIITTPYAQRGEVYNTYRRHYGPKGDPLVLVAQGTSRDFNPTLSKKVVERALERDPAAASAEYLAQFRVDIEAYVSREVVESLVVPGRYELAPVSGAHYAAFVDPSGGSSDSMTLAIGHKQDDVAILDAVREIKPPFSPEGCVSEFATLLKNYGITTITGDKYAGEWPVEQFAKFGIRYDQSAEPKSDLYRDALPVLNSGKVELLDHPRLVAQLCGLERRTARGGRDSIDHAPGGHDDVANAVAGVICSLVAGSAADGWIAHYKALAERASAVPDEVEGDDHSTRHTPFYLKGNPKQGAPMPPPQNAERQTNKDAKHLWQPAALCGNSYSDAYFTALSKAEGRSLSLQTPKCSSCGRETVDSRVTDGVRAFCDAGCQQRYATAMAERNRARAIAENGGLPLTQPIKRTTEAA